MTPLNCVSPVMPMCKQRDMGQIARELAIRAHRGHDVVGLRAHHKVVEPAALAVFHVARGGRGELLRKREVAPRGEVLVKRARVHADADGNACLACGIEHGVGLCEAADVAGVDAQLGRPAARRLHGNLRVEVDVCHHGKGRLLAYALEGIEAIAARDGHADHLASHRGEFPNLRKVGVHVVCRRIQHGLHHHGRAAA